MVDVEAMKRRLTRRWRMPVLAASVALVLAAILYVQGRGSLDDFVGRDLRKLSEGPEGAAGTFVARILPDGMFSERKRLERVLARCLPAELHPRIPFSEFESWYTIGAFPRPDAVRNSRRRRDPDCYP
jgi:hypothetical protein